MLGEVGEDDGRVLVGPGAGQMLGRDGQLRVELMADHEMGVADEDLADVPGSLDESVVVELVRRRRGSGTLDEHRVGARGDTVVAVDLELGLDPARADHIGEDRAVDGVATRVVHPAAAEDGVVEGRDEPLVGVGERGGAVGERHVEHPAVGGRDDV